MRTLLLTLFLSIFGTNISALESTDAIFREYIEWLTEHSDLEYNGEPLPGVELIPQAYLQVFGYGEDAVAESEFNNYELPEILGLYDHERNMMILPEGFDFGNIDLHHIIVHELVHYLQDINGIEDPCPGRLEPLAYKLQEKWQDSVDHAGGRPNSLFVFMLASACDERH